LGRIARKPHKSRTPHENRARAITSSVLCWEKFGRYPTKKGISMGDRGAIILRNGETADICLYTHWGAQELEVVVARALDKGSDRHYDESYLNRIIFQTLLGGDDSNTGYGLSTWEPSDIYRKIIIDHTDQTVTVQEYRYGVSHEDTGWVAFPRFTFRDFTLAVSV
jgi:hypothetical protein